MVQKIGVGLRHVRILSPGLDVRLIRLPRAYALGFTLAPASKAAYRYVLFYSIVSLLEILISVGAAVSFTKLIGARQRSVLMRHVPVLSSRQ